VETARGEIDVEDPRLEQACVQSVLPRPCFMKTTPSTRSQCFLM